MFVVRNFVINEKMRERERDREREKERERERERQRERDRAEKDENSPILRQTYLKKYIKAGSTQSVFLLSTK